MTGKTIGNYRIVRELGAGAMGAVYEGVDVMVERPVAIKMLRAEIAGQPGLIERFRSEAVTLAKLNHPCVATLYSFFRDGEEYYMVMEFVPGQTLETIIKGSGRLAPESAAQILRQALDGMAHAHRMSVLHRDIKPANIMITGEGHVKVTDFGIARVLGSSRMTREGRIIGTLEYIAPERIRGEEADIRSDLYSAGIVLFESLSGRLPFVSDTDYGLMQAQLEQPPPPLGELGVPCPPELEALLRKALAKSPADRFQTAEEFRDALAATVPAVTAAPAGPGLKPTRLATAPGLAETRLAEAPAAPSPAPKKKLPVKWIAAAAAVLVVVAAILFVVVRWPSPPTPAPVAVQPAPVAVQPPAPVEPAPAALPPELLESKTAITLPGSQVTTESKPKAPASAAREKERRRAAALKALGESPQANPGAQKSPDEEARERERKRALALKALEK